jgi:hypothetical protein
MALNVSGARVIANHGAERIIVCPWKTAFAGGASEPDKKIGLTEKFVSPIVLLIKQDDLR